MLLREALAKGVRKSPLMRKLRRTTPAGAQEHTLGRKYRLNVWMKIEKLLLQKLKKISKKLVDTLVNLCYCIGCIIMVNYHYYHAI